MRIKQRARTSPFSSPAGTLSCPTLPETARLTLTLENTRISAENTHLRQQVARLSAENTRLTAEKEELVQCRSGRRAAEKARRRVLQKRGELAEQDGGVAEDLGVWELHVEGWAEENEELKRKVARIEEELVCLRAAGRVATVVADVDGLRAAPGLLGADREGAGAGAGAGAANGEAGAENAGYRWLNYESASLSKYVAELKGKLRRQTSEAGAAKESLSQMAIRLLAAMDGHDAADAEKKDQQSRNMELASELERTRKEFTSELATARMDIKSKGYEIANLKSRNTQRSQLLRAVQDELEMRRLNDEELMEENERMLSLLAKANEASEANEANRANGENEINEGKELNEENEMNGGNDVGEVNEVNDVNGVNGVNEGYKPTEKNEGD
ncbi:uncharacterized protein H6S33_006258 [Morchella sextelata]|uniref:uncharacterized protein n=1 Tax=Morchella sextelata TaxID=1174677 RepID=UPI001D0547D3|nr:uncharacterized protein H6S33_006258 [Morchella sextelata]KAH0604590.1 hypothetical protein H6S33_006258 [Morchella sextelata]